MGMMSWWSAYYFKGLQRSFIIFSQSLRSSPLTHNNKVLLLTLTWLYYCWEEEQLSCGSKALRENRTRKLCEKSSSPANVQHQCTMGLRLVAVLCNCVTLIVTAHSSTIKTTSTTMLRILATTIQCIQCIAFFGRGTVYYSPGKWFWSTQRTQVYLNHGKIGEI